MSNTLISYAQNFEDVMLWRALKHVENGFYIDIGAQDPVIDSVSLGFYEHGWRGVHVEPTPEYAQKLRDARPDETVVQAAIGDSNALIPFFEIAGTGISTGDADIAHRHEAAGYTHKRIDVPCIKLASLLDRYATRDIHWMKIDVEGMERSVLSSWAPSAVRPWLVVVESTLPLSQEQSHTAWEGIVLGLGYRFAYFDGLNRFYVSQRHEELLGSFAMPPNVFDRFVLAGTGSHSFCVGLNSAVTQSRREVNQLKEHQSELQSQFMEKNEIAQTRVTELEIRVAQQAAVAELHAQEAESQAHQIAQANVHIEHAREERLELLRHLSALNAGHASEVANLRTELARLSQSLLEREMLVSEVRTHLQAARTEVEAARDERRELHSHFAQHEQVFTAELAAARAEHARLAEQELTLRVQLTNEESEARWLRVRLAQQTRTFNAQLVALRRSPGGRILGALGWFPTTAIQDELPHQQLEGPAIEASDPQHPPSSSLATGHVAPRQPIDSEVTMLEELLVLNDSDFVRAAYRSLLKREVDPSGERDNVALLRSGLDKVVLLRNLSRSPEGRAARVALPGLIWASWKHRAGRLPLLGRLLFGAMTLLQPRPRHDPVLAYRAQSISLQRATFDLVTELQASVQTLRQQHDRMELAIRRLGSSQGDDESALPTHSEDPHGLQFQLMRKVAAWKA